jgi:hypothetical protein
MKGWNEMKSIDIGGSGLTGSKVVEKLGTHGHQAVAASPNSGVNTITEHEAAQVERANASSATPIFFVHGLWLLPSSWDRWVTLFEGAGYVALTPGWPDDPDTVAEAREQGDPRNRRL